MPTSMFSRHNRPLSPPSTSTTATTPARSKHMYANTPSVANPNYSPTITSTAQQQKLNVVTRVAIEGRAKQGQDGAAIKMYLKISLPLDSIVAGTTVPLFQEENVKILTSQVHPLDNHSVPYNFSSTLSPLLHNAARALNLPPRSQETFDSVFNLSSPPSSSSIPSSRASRSLNGSPPVGNENIPPVDAQYTGHILVSGYNISYVLPRAYPSRNKSLQSETEGEGFPQSQYKNRRTSIGERNTAQFMAAIDMWIPYVSRPPRSPYLLSIPTPRCLHNNIKLRIFPRTTTSSSFASLSSIDDDGGTWDLTSDPHVTRTTSTRRLGRSNSYTHFADDESSDSSITGFSNGYGIQGTFPSTERVRVRWAKPLKNIDIPGGDSDARRRVGVQEVKGEMTCVIRGKSRVTERDGAEGVIMDLEYRGSCKSVWFPGVATLLGMDVGLETKGSDVFWVEGAPQEWNIAGGAGYTGFEIGPSPRQSGLVSRTNSLDSNPPHMPGSSSPEGESPVQTSRITSTSTSSLLRAPLPVQNVAEYSFEGSNANTTSSATSALGAMSSMSSLIPSVDLDAKFPGVPITLHINMNEIVPPAKNGFNFTITGTVLVVARPTLTRLNQQRVNSSSYQLRDETDSDTDPGPIVLPRFTVLAADSESTTTVIRNEIDDAPATLEVYNAIGDIRRDAQARKTVLQRGGFTKCTEDGARIAIRSIGMKGGIGNPLQPPSRPRTPVGNGFPRVSSNAALGRMLLPLRPKRDGLLMIPSIVVTVIPLLEKGSSLVDGYAVRMCLNAPADADSEWMEFGLAQVGLNSAPSISKKGIKAPNVVITSASVEGVPVYHETTAGARPAANGSTPPFEKMSGMEWLSWIRVHVGAIGGGAVVVDYLITKSKREKGKGKAMVIDESLSRVYLPTFPIPVGRLEVSLGGPSEILSVESNFAYERSMNNGCEFLLLNFSMPGFFHPHLSFMIRPLSTTPMRYRTWFGSLAFVTWVVLLITFLFMIRLNDEMKMIERALEGSSSITSGWNEVLDPVTVTTTVYASNSGAWRWYNEAPSATATYFPEQSTPPYTAYSATPSPTDPKIPETTWPSKLSFVESSAPLSTSTSLITTTETQSLLPMQHIISLYWPVHDWRDSLEKVMDALDFVWQVFRKVYHYPLDPP